MGALGGVALGAAWLVPGTALAVVLGWAACACLIWLCIQGPSPYKALYLMGALSHILAFNWLVHTISKFGGFGLFLASLIFTLFVAISAIQFPLAGLIARAIQADVKHLGLAVGLSWCTLEAIIFRLFPWSFGHTQLGFLSFVQIADIGGVAVVTLLLFWIIETALRYALLNERSKHFLLPILLFAFAISYGRYQITTFRNPDGIKQKIAVVQANVSIDDKHDAALILTNVSRYSELSKKISGPDTLIIWPESVITDFIPSLVGSVGNDERLPFFDSNNPLLIGALTVDPENRIYNSALAILNSGTVLDPYNKQILMPFGEFMPLASTFPYLLKLNPNVANFTPGSQVKVFEYPMLRADGSIYTLYASPLICYEDIIPNLSRESVKGGANILVNLTNDGWFGDSAASSQHNLIASFRAIENRRFLVRSTNTGLTAIVSPTGETVGELPTFSEGTLLADLTLISYMSLYSAFIGEWASWLIAAFTLTLVVYNRVFRSS